MNTHNIHLYGELEKIIQFLALLYKTTGRAIALPPASASALTKMFQFYVKVFKASYFLNPPMDLVNMWYKILLSPIHTPARDL